MSRMESLNNNLQGYGLDNMNDKALSDLVNQMTQVSSMPFSYHATYSDLLAIPSICCSNLAAINTALS